MWYQRSKEEILKELDADEGKGLTNEEALSRQSKYGKNKLLEQKKPSFLAMFLAQMKDALIYVLLAAAVVTLLVQEYTDAVIILMVVVLNAMIGVIQENKAEKALEALKKLTSPRAMVRRNGIEMEVDSETLVPGDVVLLDAGRFIPADLRLTESINLQIEESSLTGESVPTPKDAAFLSETSGLPLGDQKNMAFLSTLVTYGRGTGVVVATGMETQVGSIAKSLNEKDEMTPLQKRLEELGKVLGLLALSITGIMFLLGLYQKRDLFSMFMTAISLAVAAIPEGLPAIVAIVLALGVTRMSKANAIVKRLPAVETLGSVSIVCSDKTGTLTQNKMTVLKIVTPGRMMDIPPGEELPTLLPEETELLRSMVLCSDATANGTETTGDPTEIALVVLGNRAGLERHALNATYPRIDEHPFDSDRKLMSTLHREGAGYRIHTKGALDQLLKHTTKICIQGKTMDITEAHRKDILAQSEALSAEALRILGVAIRDVEAPIPPESMEQDLLLLGFVAMIDPPREEVKAAIQEAKSAGITPVMITGDHRVTALAIARELDMAHDDKEVLTGADIDRLGEEAFADVVDGIRVFARVSPEHKVKIVKAFKAKGHVVSMTGDGVNDAPSLKHADIGVAMGITGTDVSKGASDMILTDDNFTTIIEAIEEGRNIYNNIKKAVVFLLSCNLGEIVAIFVAVLFNFAIPLLPTQILWVNLVTDTFPALALGVDPSDHDVMKKKPRNPKESFFSEGAAIRAIVGGLLIGATTLAAFAIGLSERGVSLFASQDAPQEVLIYARTMAFVVLATSQLFYSLTMRSAKKSIFSVGLFKNLYLIGAIVIGILLQAMVITVPFIANAFKVTNLPFADWGIVFLLAGIPFGIIELWKMLNRMGKREEAE